MNGAQSKIEIFKPFGEAFGVMKKILFQPFDLGKWCVIGFAAFLANLGGGFNFRYNYNQRSDLREWHGFQNLIDEINQIPHWIIVLGVGSLVTLILAIAVVFAWLRARGRFMFIDCIVKNRGAIAEPWREFRQEGNGYFLFSLLIGCAFLVIVTLLALPFLLPIVRGVTFLHLHDVYLISMIVLWAVVFLLLVVAWALVAHFMVAVMYRRRCRAHEAFRMALSLIASYPGEITLYCLFWIVLVLGAAFVACASMCATCCIALIPYVGTVILLPLYVWLRAFSLMFLRQFGPDYDVWAGVQQPEPQPTPPSLGPPPPPA
jgi:hypothetical protein